jgi:hypothetical protein
MPDEHRPTQAFVVNPKDEWVVARYGVETPQFLTRSGKWGTIATAAWYSDRATARDALCPPGTTGTSIHMAPARRT